MDTRAHGEGEGRVAPLERVLVDWLLEPTISIVAGRWEEGAIMELFPNGSARLAPAMYRPPFAGVRDITIAATNHHLHVDLDRLERVVYTLVPCVCYGHRPSFDIRFLPVGVDDPHQASFTLTLARPYEGESVAGECIRKYFSQMCLDVARYPDAVGWSMGNFSSREQPSSFWQTIFRTGFPEELSADVSDAGSFDLAIRKICSRAATQKNEARTSDPVGCSPFGS